MLILRVSYKFFYSIQFNEVNSFELPVLNLRFHILGLLTRRKDTKLLQPYRGSAQYAQQSGQRRMQTPTWLCF
jgi:hypothetical protein